MLFVTGQLWIWKPAASARSSLLGSVPLPGQAGARGKSLFWAAHLQCLLDVVVVASEPRVSAEKTRPQDLFDEDDLGEGDIDL